MLRLSFENPLALLGIDAAAVDAANRLEFSEAGGFKIL